MQPDIRRTTAYREVAAWLEAVHGPGFGDVSDAADLAPSPDGSRIAFTGTVRPSLDEAPREVVGIVDVGTTTDSPPHTAGRGPAWAPDGTRLALLSDRDERGVFQVWLVDGDLREATRTATLDGTVESVAWSPDGARLLAVVAGRGAELAGIAGSGRTATRHDARPAWAPTVHADDDADAWRWAAVLDPGNGSVTRVTAGGTNVWEAAWVDDSSIVVVRSSSPNEGSWYDASVAIVDTATSDERELYAPAAQVGAVTPSPSGRHVAVIACLASDRDVLAGRPILLSPGRAPDVLDTAGVDVTHVAWRDDDRLVVSGLQGSETVIAEVDVTGGWWHERWRSRETCGGRVGPRAWPLGEGDGVASVLESAQRPPSIVTIQDATVHVLRALSHPGTDAVRSVLAATEDVTWTAPDGRTIQGWLSLPVTGAPPFPTIVELHGGPVWASRNVWPGRVRALPSALRRGYAYFRPNPRGSHGWGHDFADQVVGDLGGADVDDVLSGVDHLVAQGLADPARLAVTGTSYGGYLTYVLITRTRRFGAAVALSPVSDYVSARYSCNIPEFVERFLDDEPGGGRYLERSPLHAAVDVRTPTLHVTGAHDRCAPPTQGEFMHRALLRAGHVASVYVEYPLEGHGVQGWPATVDYLSRLFDWFDRHGVAPGADVDREVEREVEREVDHDRSQR